MSFHRKPFFFIILLGMLFTSVPVAAVQTVILVANSSHFSLLHRIETAVYATPTPNPKLVRLEAEELVDAHQLETLCENHCALVVAVGAQATKAVLETKTKHPILSILIRKHAFDDLLEKHQHDNGTPPHIQAIFLDQPFKRQLNLILNLLPLKKKYGTVGVLLGPTSQLFQERLEEDVKEYPFKLHIIHVTNQDNVISALDVLLEDVDLIWAIPDGRVYNERTARGLLLSAYRKHVPMVGFSRTYVSNGALAAVYSSPKQIATQTADTIMSMLTKKGHVPLSTFPDTFSIAGNYQVARSMEVEMESEASLHYRLQLQECEESDKLECRRTTKPMNIIQKD